MPSRPRRLPGPEGQPTTQPTSAPSAPLPVSANQPSLVVPVATIHVTAADLGLAQYWQSDGGMLILPSYVLTADDGSHWSIPAIADQYVRFVPPPTAVNAS